MLFLDTPGAVKNRPIDQVEIDGNYFHNQHREQETSCPTKHPMSILPAKDVTLDNQNQITIKNI